MIRNKNNSRFSLARFFACLILLQVFIASFSFLLPSTVAAAADGGDIVQGHNYLCKPVIHPAGTGYISLLGSAQQQPIGWPTNNKDASATWSKVGDNMVYIDFVGVDSKNNADCQSSMYLLQSAQTPTQFYGGWWDHSNTGGPRLYDYAQAVVNPTAKSVAFSIDSLNKSFDLNLDDPNHVLTNGAYFPGQGAGGGNTSAGCNLETVAANDKCLDVVAAGFIDAATISFYGEKYHADSWGGSGALASVMRYKLISSPYTNRQANNTHGSDTCTPYFDLNTSDVIDANLDGDGGISQLQQFRDAINNVPGSVNLKYVNFDTSCNNRTEGTRPVSTAGFKIWATYYPKDNQISPVFTTAGDNEKQYIGAYTSQGSNVFALSSSSCTKKNQFQLSSAPGNDSGVDVNSVWVLVDPSHCDSVDVNVQVVVAPQDASAPTNGSTTDQSGQGNDFKLDCDVSLLNPLTWLACPLIDAANKGVNAFGGIIEDYLNVNTGTYLNETIPIGAPNYRGGQDFYSIWSTIRTISIIFLVIILLVMVFSQTLGGGFLDAYTVRKLVPRLLAAIIFLSLSWQITKLLVDISNILGEGIRSLIYSAFHSVRSVTVSSSSSSALAIGGIALAGTLGLIGMLSFAITALIAVVTAVVILVFRKIALIFLAILSPLAIVCFILPNTQRYWKLWWDNFLKLLLAFPLIMGFIALGRVFAGTVPPDGNLADQIIVFVAYFGPYFMLPTVFKMAGGLMATASGMANQFAARGYKATSAFRANERKKQISDITQGNLFRGGTQENWRGRLNRGAQRSSMLNKAGINPRNWRANMATALGNTNFDRATKFLEENDTARAIGGDDDKLWAVMNGTDEDSVRRELLARAPERFSDPNVLNQAISEVMRFRKEAGTDVARIAATIAQAGTGTGFNYRSDGVNDDMFDAIINASGSNRGVQGRMLAMMRSKALQSGRPGLAGGGYAKSAQIMDQRRTAMANGGWIPDANAPNGRRRYGEAEARLDLLQDVLQSNAGAAVAGKVEDVKQFAPLLRANAEAALDSGNTVVAARELAKLAGKYDAASQIAPQNAEALADGVLANGIEFSHLNPDIKDMLISGLSVSNPTLAQDLSNGQQNGITYQQAIEAMRGNADFQTMRREYQTQGVAAANAAALAAAGGVQGGPQNPGNFQARY